MRVKVLKQFSHFRLGAFVARDVANIDDNYASHLIEIGVVEEIKEVETETANEVSENGNKRTRSRKP